MINPTLTILEGHTDSVELIDWGEGKEGRNSNGDNSFAAVQPNITRLFPSSSKVSAFLMFVSTCGNDNLISFLVTSIWWCHGLVDCHFLEYQCVMYIHHQSLKDGHIVWPS